jgi:glycosyltransferase involved in cell wall biosynthesis
MITNILQKKSKILISIFFLILLFGVIIFFILSKNTIYKEHFTENDNIITFIIPTIGRKSLIESLNSIINQKNKNWKAIVIFDGIEPTIKSNDERIKIIKIIKKGTNKNNAGFVRNEGIKLVDTKWIAFLDDDDFIKDDYVDTFNNTLNKYPELDVLIFRMISCDKQILPELKTDNFYESKVGISFLMTKKLFDNGYTFLSGNTEDFVLLDKIRNDKHKMLISPYIKYYVRCNYQNEMFENGNEVKINF